MIVSKPRIRKGRSANDGMGQDYPQQKPGVQNTKHKVGGEERDKRSKDRGAILSRNPEYDSSSDTLCMHNTRRDDMANRICNEIQKVVVDATKTDAFIEDIWVRQSFEASRAAKEALQLESDIEQTTRIDLELQNEKDLSISEGLLETDRDESVIGLLKTTRNTFESGLFCLKLFDFLFNLNLIALGSVCFHISYKFETHQVTLPSNTSSIDMDWLDHNITVLGRTDWTMSLNHFTLIFSIFHIVYGIIAVICDLIFFQSLFKKMIKSRYISTVLPVHRLFFVVISCFDGILFASSTNITYLVGDVFAVILIILISILVLADTFIILFSFKAVSGKPGLVFSKPWRNLVMLLVIILTIIYAVTSQHPLYTWDLGPSLGWGVISVILLLKCLLETTVCNRESAAPPEDNVLHFLTCISSTNVLGLCSVGAVAHSLIFDYYSTIFDHL